MNRVKKWIVYLPVAALSVALVYSIYIASTTKIVLMDKHYVGIVAVILCVVFSIRKLQTGKIITLCTLLLGVFNLIAFTPVVYTYSLGFSINGIGPDWQIQEFSFVVMLLFVIVNFGSIRSNITKLLSDREARNN